MNYYQKNKEKLKSSAPYLRRKERIEVHCCVCNSMFFISRAVEERNKRKKKGNYCSKKCGTQERNDKLLNSIYFPLEGKVKCANCQEKKTFINFHKSKSSKSGYGSWCRQCQSELRQTKYQPSIRKSRLRRFNLTPEQFDAMVIEQNNSCKICKTVFLEGKARDRHIDHDHITGKVRGLLCNYCNVGLGHFFDDASKLQEAIKYLTNPA